ncbi:hypothetical protein AAC387_Pa02g2833 [Persea americana]
MPAPFPSQPPPLDPTVHSPFFLAFRPNQDLIPTLIYSRSKLHLSSGILHSNSSINKNRAISFGKASPLSGHKIPNQFPTPITNPNLQSPAAAAAATVNPDPLIPILTTQPPFNPPNLLNPSPSSATPLSLPSPLQNSNPLLANILGKNVSPP